MYKNFIKLNYNVLKTYNKNNYSMTNQRDVIMKKNRMLYFAPYYKNYGSKFCIFDLAVFIASSAVI